MEVVYSPRLISFEDQIVKINAGADHSCFIDANQRLYSCGKNDQGQLGVGSFKD
jgi:alpha-tubulin suppressor-like RCC1 family protein